MGLWPSTPAKEEPSQSTTGNIDALVDLRIAHPPAREAREDTGQNKEQVDQAAGGTMSPMLEPLQPPPLYVTHMVRSCIESSCLTSGQHNRAWDIVREHMSSSLRIMAGRAADSLTTLMPMVNEWTEQTFQDVAEVRDVDDHCVVCWINLPSQGILTAHKREWVTTFVANLLHKYKRNGIAVLIHANRAGQADRTWGSVETSVQKK